MTGTTREFKVTDTKVQRVVRDRRMANLLNSKDGVEQDKGASAVRRHI